MHRDVEVVRSRANAALKRVRAALAGRAEGLAVLEGERLVRDAVAAGYPLELLLVSEAQASLADALPAREVRVVQADLMELASGLRSAPGVLALACVPPRRALEDLPLGPRSLLLVVAGVADPGNLGALARSAEAAGAQALAVVAGGARPWNEKALRGSMGSLLRLPVVEVEDAAQLARALAAGGVRQVAAATRGGAHYGHFDWSGPLALWVAGETGALPAGVGPLEPVTIPMAGGVESLNVTVAASLLLFAAARAREAAR